MVGRSFYAVYWAQKKIEKFKLTKFYYLLHVVFIAETIIDVTVKKKEAIIKHNYR